MGRAGKKVTKGHKFFVMRDIFFILIMEMVSGVYTYVEIYQIIYFINM